MIEQSESIAELSQALAKFHGEVGKIKKSSNNPFFHSKYASLSDILDAISSPLEKSGLAVVQFPVNEGLATQLVHTSGEWMRASFSMPPVEAVIDKNTGEKAVTPQSMGSAITYARRYAISAVLCLNIDEDDDGNAASSAPQRAAGGSYAQPAPQALPRNNNGSYSRSGEKPTIPNGVQNVTVTEVYRSKPGAAKDWERVNTELGGAFNNTGRPMIVGATYTAIVDNGAITSATTPRGIAEMAADEFADVDASYGE